MIDAAARGLLIVAGEASGDLHGARMLSALCAREPSLRAYGLGGEELEAAGLERLADAADISVVGITEVLRILGRAREIFADLLAAVDARGTRVAVLIDFPEFNLRLAKALATRGVRVVYYVSPQVWAWRRGRVRTIAANVERMLVLFRFERDFYRQHDVASIHVGHPLVDEVAARAQAWDACAEDATPSPVRVAVLPGSRPSEVRALLPPMLGAVRTLAATHHVAPRLIQARTVPTALFDQLIEEAGVEIERVHADRYTAIADAHLALCASGTATLEVALLRTPMVVIYRVSRWSYWLGRLLVRLPAISLVNLVLGKRTVAELLQGDARPERIAAEARRLVDDHEARAAMRADLASVRERLGTGGATERTADEVIAVWRDAVGEGAP